jgi:sugar phosphate isomerase/epimerase
MIELCAFSDEAGKSLEEQIAALKRNGINKTELRSVSGVNISKISVEEAKKIQKELSQNQISVFSIGSPLGKVDINLDFESYLENECRHVFTIANIFKTDKVRVFSFYNAYDKEELVFQYMRRMCSLAAEYGVSLYHENEKDIYGDVKERIEKLFFSVPELKMVYDPANFILCGESADKTLPLVKMAGYLHIKDAILESGEIVPAGEGDGKISEVIKNAKGDITATIEPHLKVFDGYATLDAHELKNKFSFKDNNEAFDAAVSAFKKIINS